MADFQSILKEIKAKKTAPVYILMGEEPYYLDRITDCLEHSIVAEEDKEFDLQTLYGADSDAGMILESATQYPFVSPLRLVIVKEAQSMVRAKAELDKLASYVANPNKSTVLAIVFKGDKLNATSSLLKAAKKNNEIVIFESPKIKDYKVPGIVKSYCAANKINMDDSAIEVLVANVGASLEKLFAEIEKLRVAMKDSEKRITADMVHDHIGISKEFNNFELVKALATRNYFSSINIIKHFEENPKEHPTILIVAIVFRLFQQLLLAAFSTDKSDKGLMEAAQLKNAYALSEIKTGLRNYNASQLVKAIRLIREFDTKSKGINSYQKEYPLLQELVCNLLTL